MRYLADVTSLTYDEEKCTGCGRCVEVCPHGVFALRDDKSALTSAPLPRGEEKRKGASRKAVVLDRDRCMECGACVQNCDFGALSVNAGVGCAGAIIAGLLTGKEPTCGCDDSGCC